MKHITLVFCFLSLVHWSYAQSTTSTPTATATQIFLPPVDSTPTNTYFNNFNQPDNSALPDFIAPPNGTPVNTAFVNNNQLCGHTQSALTFGTAVDIPVTFAFSAVAQSDQGLEWHVAGASSFTSANSLEALIGLDGGNNPPAFTISAGLGNTIFRQSVLPALQPNTVYDTKVTFATTADPLVVDVSGTLSLHGSATPFFSSGVHSIQLTAPLHYFLIIVGRDPNSLTCLDDLTIGYVPIPTTPTVTPSSTSTPTPTIVATSVTASPRSSSSPSPSSTTVAVHVKKVKKHKKETKKNPKAEKKGKVVKQKGETNVKKNAKKDGKKGNKK